MSFLGTYCVLEFFLFPRLLTFLPLHAQPYLHKSIQPLAQSSKSGTLPENYTLILGDSYAKGSGQWLLDVNKWGNGAFHSAHVLHQLTGEDFLSIAQTGAGNLRTMVANPREHTAYLDKSWLFSLPSPKRVLVYFYEGNDLTDNIREPIKYCKKRCNEERMYDVSYLPTILEERIMPYHSLYERSKTFAWYNNLFLFDFARTMFLELGKNKGSLRQKLTDENLRFDTNIALIGGKEFALPAEAQGPGLELTEDEFKTALDIFAFSLSEAQKLFPASSFTVIHVPSVLSSYELTSKEVSTRSYFNRRKRYKTSELYQRSDLLARGLQRISTEHSAEFVDARRAIREQSKDAPVHGPEEWKHFNRRGYHALAQAIHSAWSRAPSARSTARAPGQARQQ